MAFSKIQGAGVATDTLKAEDIADDAIGTAELANDVSISTSGNIATTGSGTLAVAGTSTHTGAVTNASTSSLQGAVTLNSGSNTITFPTIRATKTNFVLAMSDKDTGATAWQATASAPTINSISGSLNHDQDSTLTLFGADFKDTTEISLWTASSGGSQVGGIATITNQTDIKLEATFGHGALTAGDTVYVEGNNSGIKERFATALTISTDPDTITFAGATGSSADTTTHLGTYGGALGGGSSELNTKLLTIFDRLGGQDWEDSSNTGGDGHLLSSGNTTFIKASPFGDGKSAMYFDGSNDKLSIDSHTDFNVASTMTIECWIRPTGTNQTIFSRSQDSGGASSEFKATVSSNAISINFYKTGGGAFDTTLISHSGITYNAWNHVAIVRNSDVWDIFINGIGGLASGSFATDVSSEFQHKVRIGTNWRSGAVHLPFSGYIDEVRIVQGVAVYTGDFTVPTSRLTAITGTKLLIHSNRTDEGNTTFTDSATSGTTHTITATGVIHSKLHGGIAPALAWPASGKATGSAGVYFNGAASSTTKTLEIDNENSDVLSQCIEATDQDYSIDCWVNFRELPTSDSNQVLICTQNGSGNSFSYGREMASGTETWGICAPGPSRTHTNNNSAGKITLNTWHHILFDTVRQSSSPRITTYIYIDGLYWGYDTVDTAHNASLRYIVFGAGRDHDSSGTYYSVPKAYVDNFRISKGRVTADTTDPLYTGGTTSNSSINFNDGLPSSLYGIDKSKTLPTITFTGALASGSLSTSTATGVEDIEFSSVANSTLPSGMQSLTDTKIGLTLTNLTDGDANKATLTGTMPDTFVGTSRANLPVKAQVRKTLTNAAYDSTGSSKRLVTFSSPATTGGLSPGMEVTGTGIAASTTITSVDSATTLTLSADTTGGDLETQTLIFGDPERAKFVNGGTTDVLVTGDTMLTIGASASASPVLFNARRYVGNSLAREINNFGFKPDLIWTKERGGSTGHSLVDSVRGISGTGGGRIGSDSNSGADGVERISGFISDGFSTKVGAFDYTNTVNKTYVGWGWKAGGVPSANNKSANGTSTEDSIATVLDTSSDSYNGNTSSAQSLAYVKRSVNTAGGFSITEFKNRATDNGSTAIPHGLGSIPDFVLIKSVSASGDWHARHTSMTSNTVLGNRYALLNTDDDEEPLAGGTVASSAYHVYTQDSSSAAENDADAVCIMYAWKAVAGVSAFGTYTASTSVTLGWQPKFVIVKKISAVASWHMFDSFRGVLSRYVLANSGGSEVDNGTNRDITINSTGFVAGSDGNVGSSGTFIYAAFA